MTHETVTKVRKVDIGMIINLLVLAGLIWGLYSKPAKWDQAADKVERMEPVVWQTKNRLDVADAHWADLIRRLDRIERKLDK